MDYNQIISRINKSARSEMFKKITENKLQITNTGVRSIVTRENGHYEKVKMI